MISRDENRRFASQSQHLQAIADATRTRELARAAYEAADRALRRLMEGEAAHSPPAQPDRWLGPKEAARIVDRSPTSLSRDIRRGKVGEVHDGRARIRHSELLAAYAPR